ncbi:MAG: hypothetical protein NT087_00720, partial [Deltaproteobacteria bacterium]|nr:hypothetical protein [Deltaproteobacteria bacterium]
FSALHNFLQNKLEQDEQDEPSLNSPFILAEHSVKEKDVKELLVEALKLNWQHARHIEIQRIALNLAYIGLMAAFAAFVLDKDLKPVSTLIVIHVAVFLTFLCWGMTSKWNLAFQKQIQKADACARTLQMSGNQNNILSLHEFVGFPAPDKSLTRLTVRGMFSILHWGIFSIWIIIAIFVFCFKDAEPHFNYMQEKNPEYTKCYAFPPYYHDPVVRLNVSTSSRNRP